MSLRYKVSESTIKRRLKNIAVEWHNPKLDGHGVVNIHATYFGRDILESGQNYAFLPNNRDKLS